MAKSCILMGKPYVGVCFNDMHSEKLMARLTDMIVTEINDPQSKFHNFAPKKRKPEEAQVNPNSPETKPKKPRKNPPKQPKAASESDDPVIAVSDPDSESANDA